MWLCLVLFTNTAPWLSIITPGASVITPPWPPLFLTVQSSREAMTLEDAPDPCTEDGEEWGC